MFCTTLLCNSVHLAVLHNVFHNYANELALVSAAEEAFGNGIIPATPFFTHTTNKPI
jgi:hypothetical protein